MTIVVGSVVVVVVVVGVLKKYGICEHKKRHVRSHDDVFSIMRRPTSPFTNLLLRPCQQSTTIDSSLVRRT